LGRLKRSSELYDVRNTQGNKEPRLLRIAGDMGKFKGLNWEGFGEDIPEDFFFEGTERLLPTKGLGLEKEMKDVFGEILECYEMKS